MTPVVFILGHVCLSNFAAFLPRAIASCPKKRKIDVLVEIFSLCKNKGLNEKTGGFILTPGRLNLFVQNFC